MSCRLYETRIIAVVAAEAHAEDIVDDRRRPCGIELVADTAMIDVFDIKSGIEFGPIEARHFRHVQHAP